MSYDRILLDIESQKEFFTPGGSLYVPAAEAARRNIRRLFQWARASRIPVISTVLRVRMGDVGPYGPAPLEGSPQEQKIPGTILPSRINLGLLNSTDLPDGLFTAHQQVIVEKRDTDIFAHARLERLITEIGRATFVLCGAGLSYGLVQAAVGLRSRGFPVIAAADAILPIEDRFTPMARLRMEAKGVIFTATSGIVAPRAKAAGAYRSDAVLKHKTA